MSAGIEENDMVILANQAWHKLGTVLGHPLTWEDYQSHPWMFEPVKAGTYVQTPLGMMPMATEAIIRSDDYQVLNPSVTGRRALTLPTESVDYAVEAFLSAGLASHVETKGTVEGGKKLFVTLKLAQEIDLGYTILKPFFTLFDSHDGSTCAGGRLTGGLVVCANTFAAHILVKDEQAGWKFPHLTNVQDYYQTAVRAITEASEAVPAVKRSIEALANTPVSDADWSALVGQLIGDRPEDKGRGQTMYDTRRAAICSRRNGSDIAPVRATAWGSLMAVQGYEQHDQPARGTSQQARHLGRLNFGRLPMTEQAVEILTADMPELAAV